MPTELLQLPKMKCDKGCTHCCTISGGSQAEFNAVMKYAREHGIVPRRQGQRCPFYLDGRCSVYPVRPLVCRFYGHTPRMECPRGYNVNVKPKVEKRVWRAYFEDIKATGDEQRYLHEAVFTLEEVKRMLPEFKGQNIEYFQSIMKG